MQVFQKYSNKIDGFIFNDVWQSLNFSKIETKPINVQIVNYFKTKYVNFRMIGKWKLMVISPESGIL